VKIGYARVSTQDQNLDLQIDALKKEGCERIYEEKASGGKADRPELTRMLEHLRSGDILVIWKLDRLGRSLRHLIDLVETLKNMGVELVSIQDSVNTATPAGKLTFAIFGALAEFERDIIRERTMAGLAAARARGRKGGRKKALSQSQVEMLLSMTNNKNLPIGEICRQLKISKATYYNYLKEKIVTKEEEE
jgi:DNA invertase Pin-like site-specific DNA recombinase